jgi:hypothetical protein
MLASFLLILASPAIGSLSLNKIGKLRLFGRFEVFIEDRIFFFER